MDDCIYCKIAIGLIPSYKIYEDNDIIAVLDIFPNAKGNIIVMSKKHYEDPFSIPDEVIGKVFVLSKYLSGIVMQLFKYSGVNLLVNFGKIPGNKQHHFVVHLIPRFDGDNVKFLIPKNQSNSAELEEVRQAIIKMLNLNKKEEEKKVEKKEEKNIDFNEAIKWFYKKI
mgnify:CR=1 FL=1